MTETNHYREAEQSLKRVMNANSESDERFHLGLAQVHATLALTEANAKTIAPAVPPATPPVSRTEQVAGLRAIADMLEAHPQLDEIAAFAFDRINVPVAHVGDSHEALQTMVTAALAHGATASLHKSGDYAGVLLSWNDRVVVHVYARPHQLGNVAALLPSAKAVTA